MIDLHCHSTASDGSYSPSELIKFAAELGVTHIALTDHDTADGVDEFMTAGLSLGINTIPGIELSVDYNVGELHMVGLFIDKDAAPMKSLLDEVKFYRRNRNEIMLGKLSALVKKQVKVSDLVDDPKSQLGRPHMAKYLLRNGIAKTIDEAFSVYLSEGGLLSAPKKRVTPENAISVIKSAGGIAILAHPSTLKLNDMELELLAKEYKELGLDAIEVFSSHSPDEKKGVYLGIAKKCGLAISCGSDFHGANSKIQRLGADLGDMVSEKNILEVIYELSHQNHFKS